MVSMTVVDTDHDRLSLVERKLDELLANSRKIVGTLDEFRPILDRYKRALDANSFRQARKALKGDT